MVLPYKFKRKYNLLLQAAYAVVFSAMITLLSFTEIDLSLTLLCFASLFIWVFSGWLINDVARRRGDLLGRDEAVLPTP